MSSVITKLQPVAVCLASLVLLTGCKKEEGAATATPVASTTPTSTATPDVVSKAAPAKPLVKDPTVSAPDDNPNAKSLTTKDGRPPVPISSEFIVVAEPATLNLGQIPTGETMTGTISLRNTGSRSMTVGKTKTSCGCTTAQLEAGRVLAAGEVIDVEIRMKGGQTARTLNKTVTFNIEGQPPLVVPVRGDAVAFVKAEPTQMHPDRQPDGKFTLTSVDGEPFRVISMVPPMIDDFPIEAASEIELTLPWDKFNEVGQRRKLILYTDHPKCQQVYMDIRLDGTEYANARPQQQAVADGQSAVELKRQVSTPGGQLAAGSLSTLIASGQQSLILEAISAEELDVDARDNSGSTLLGLAAKAGNIEMIEALIDAGADLEAPDKAGRTPLMSGSESKNAEVLDALLAAGASLQARDNIGGTAISWAAAFGNQECVQTLIDAGARVDIVGTATGYTPLMWAAGFGEPGSIDPLVEAGAQLEATDLLEGLTPLMHASRTGKVDGIKRLVALGADIESTDRVGRTAFLTASAESGGTVEKLEALIEAGANTTVHDKRDQNALELARRRTDLRAAEVIAFLEDLLGSETATEGE